MDSDGVPVIIWRALPAHRWGCGVRETGMGSGLEQGKGLVHYGGYAAIVLDAVRDAHCLYYGLVSYAW